MAKRKPDTARRMEEVRRLEDPDALIAALDDPSPLVVEAAAQRIVQPRAAGALLRTYLRLDEDGLERDPGCWARIALIERLGRLEAPEGEEAARRAIRTVQVEPVGFGMGDTATGLRVAAASLMANIRPPGALVDLAWLLFDFEPNVGASRNERPFAKLACRQAAARAIGALGDPAGAAVLHVKLCFPGEELPEVLVDCMDALAELREPRTMAFLQPFLDGPSSYLAAAAATAMAAAEGERSLPALLGALERAGKDLKEALVYAIGSIRAEGARQALERLAGHPDKTVSSAAKSILGK